MKDGPLGCLLIEDNPGDARLLRELLRDGPPGAVALRLAASMAEAEASLRAEPADVVLLDLGLPDSQDVDSIQRVRAAAPGVPVVLLTGLDDERLSVRAAREGASDYLVKGQVDGRGLVRTLRYAVERRGVEAERDRLQAQLLHAQKLEVVGRVAGGVAHDLNNILSVILNTSSLGAEGLAGADPLRRDLEEIQAATGRAAALTKKLLLFSRRDPAVPRNVDLARITADVARMLVRLLGETIQVETRLQEGIGPVCIDPGHAEQVIVNLAVNARDAMPRGGTLTVEVFAETAATGAGRPGGPQPGGSVALRVSDTGTGIPPEASPHLFEPFFTTKAAGQGTGLGLSIVHGIVGQAGGAITFETEVGRGTSFTVHLPLAAGAAPAAPEPEALPVVRPGVRALVVEDDDGLRRVARRVLEQAGLRVEEARSAGDALLAAETAAAPFDLLLADVVLPALDGPAVAERLQARHPGLRVVYMSGYSAAEVERRGLDAERCGLVRKPFTPEALLRAVADAMGG